LLRKMMAGTTSEEIARVEGVAVREVQASEGRVLRKLGAASRGELVRLLF